jgi:hypothetical protein
MSEKEKFMKSLNLGIKKINLAIDGDENRIFTFCPSDSAVRGKFLEFCKSVEGIAKRLENIDTEGLKETADDGKIISEKDKYEAEIEQKIEHELRESFDSIFGCGSAYLVFGNIGLLTETADGQPAIVTAINAILPYFAEESRLRTEKYTKGLN